MLANSLGIVRVTVAMPAAGTYHKTQAADRLLTKTPRRKVKCDKVPITIERLSTRIKELMATGPPSMFQLFKKRKHMHL
jgi:hypothetical protein